MSTLLIKRHPSGSASSDGLLVPMASEPGLGPSTRSGVRRASSGSRKRDISNERSYNISFFVKLFLMLVLLAGAALAGYYYFKITLSERIQEQYQTQLEQERAASKDLQSKLISLEAEKSRIALQLSSAQAKLEESEAKGVAAADAPDTGEKDAKIAQLVEYKKKIKTSLQQFARRRLLDAFGPGPHRVEIQLAFDPDSNDFNEDGGDRIVIEMAPAEDMPYTVWWFLNQVGLGLYNYTSFHRNAGHVVQGGPTPNFLTPKDLRLAQQFEDSGFDSVLFQEYSPNFKHYKYTLGYAGRPGGPDFYISTLNNEKNHGPGGQSSYADPSEADPCFAKVVEGFEAVDRMHKSTVKPGGYKRMEHYVAIKHMIILPNGEKGRRNSSKI